MSTSCMFRQRHCFFCPSYYSVLNLQIVQFWFVRISVPLISVILDTCSFNIYCSHCMVKNGDRGLGKFFLLFFFNVE